MRIIISSVITAFLVLLCGNLFAQDAETTDTAPVVETETVQEEKEVVPASAVEVKKPVQIPAKAVVVKKTEAAKIKPPATQVQPAVISDPALDSLSLIESAEGDFRYSRIQGITVTKKQQMVAQEVMTNASDKTAANPEKVSGKSGWLVKIALVIIILIIFLLYKFGNKQRKGRVLRRFP